MTGQSRPAGPQVDEVLEFLDPLVPVSELDRSALPVVTLDPSVVEALEIHGQMRASAVERSIDNHVKGILGEYAVAKHLHIPDRVDTEVYEDGDPGFDFKFNGWKVDVKTAGRHVNNPSLHVRAGGEYAADYYVLAHQLNRYTYRVIGCAPRPRVRRARTFTFSRSRELWPDRYGDTVHRVEQDRLEPVAKLSDG